MPASTVDHLLDDDVQARVRRGRRIASIVTTALLAVILGAAVVDITTSVPIVGPDSATVRAQADDGTVLTVRHPTVARPALAVPFDVVVTKPGGFDEGEQVTLAFDSEYLVMFDLNGILPAPAEETADGDRVLWTFDAPDGEVLRIVYEARIEPGVQEEHAGSVALLDDQGAVSAEVEFSTAVRP